jgi:transglutaminase-like putative cysteine protease
MRTTCTLLALLLAAAPAAAQAPVIDERGDPSVRADTIYRLAVDPADYPEEEHVLLLDDGVVRMEADGTGSRTYRTVVQVLTQDAAENWGELSFGWDLKRERFRLNWARVIDAQTGRVISDKPVHDQESLAPVDFDAPVYTDQQTRRVSLGAVQPGVIVDYSYTTETVEPVMAGDWVTSWSIHTGAPTMRSRYILDLPAGYQPRIQEHNLTFRRREQERGGRRVYTWAVNDLPKIDPEPFMAVDSNRVYMRLAIGGRTEWAEVARWYHGLSADRYALTPEIEARLAEVVKDARTREDSLRAVHRWVAQDFRYVSLSLGIGGYQPRTPEEVMRTQYGDCKDKATLFIALARRMGVNAHPVLLNSFGAVDEGLPSISQFNHMIAAVERPGGGYTFLDLTAELIPWGEVSPGYQGEFGLVVHPDGRAEPVTFPRDEPARNRMESSVAGELAEDGTFSGVFTTTTRGALQYELRSAFASRISPRDRQEITRNMAQNVFEGARGDSLEIFDGKDLRAEVRTRLWLSGGRAATPSGGTLILTLPFGNGSMREIISQLESRREPRRFDIDVADVIGPLETMTEYRVTLPEGYRARLPRNVDARSVFGSYQAEFTQEGRELRVVRRMSGRRGTEPRERLPELLAFLKDMSRDDVQLIVVEPATD